MILLGTEAPNNGSYSRRQAISPEQFQCVFSEGVESEELVFDFAIFAELDFPHLVGQKWLFLHWLEGHACNSVSTPPNPVTGKLLKTPFGALWRSDCVCQHTFLNLLRSEKSERLPSLTRAAEIQNVRGLQRLAGHSMILTTLRYVVTLIYLIVKDLALP